HSAPVTEATKQAGPELARIISSMRAVADHGTPLVDNAARLEGGAALGVDETSFLKATRLTPTRWITGLVDLERGRLLDVVADRTRAAGDRWPGGPARRWL